MKSYSQTSAKPAIITQNNQVMMSKQNYSGDDSLQNAYLSDMSNGTIADDVICDSVEFSVESDFLPDDSDTEVTAFGIKQFSIRPSFKI